VTKRSGWYSVERALKCIVWKQRFGIVVYQAVTMNNELNTRTLL
jgi:hypothetical protein